MCLSLCPADQTALLLQFLIVREQHHGLFHGTPGSGNVAEKTQGADALDPGDLIGRVQTDRGVAVRHGIAGLRFEGVADLGRLPVGQRLIFEPDDALHDLCIEIAGRLRFGIRLDLFHCQGGLFADRCRPGVAVVEGQRFLALLLRLGASLQAELQLGRDLSGIRIPGRECPRVGLCIGQ